MHNDGVVVYKVQFQCSLNLALNTACGNSTGSNRIEKGKFVNLLDLFQGRWEKGLCHLLRGLLSDDWAILVYVEVLFTCDECRFNSLGSWSYSKKWVWILETQCMYSFINSFIDSFIREMSAK